MNEPKKWTEKEMIYEVAKMFGVRKFTIVPNVMQLFRWNVEIDLVVLDNKSRYAREIEIKLSRADFLADKKKVYQHDSALFKYFYYALPVELYPEVIDLIPSGDGVILVDGRYYPDYVHTAVKKKPLAKRYYAKWNGEQAFQLARLGTLRFWNYFNKELEFLANKDTGNE